MSKFVVCISGKPNINGYKRGEFHWDESLKLYVYQKLVFDEAQFNEVVKKALDRYHDMNPKVRCIQMTPAVIVQPAPQFTVPLHEHEALKVELSQTQARFRELEQRRGSPQVEDLDCPVVATITAAHEVTLEEAEAVILRLAPNRLKKKTGPKVEATG